MNMNERLDNSIVSMLNFLNLIIVLFKYLEGGGHEIYES